MSATAGGVSRCCACCSHNLRSSFRGLSASEGLDGACCVAVSRLARGVLSSRLGCGAPGSCWVEPPGVRAAGGVACGVPCWSVCDRMAASACCCCSSTMFCMAWLVAQSGSRSMQYTEGSVGALQRGLGDNMSLHGRHCYASLAFAACRSPWKLVAQGSAALRLSKHPTPQSLQHKSASSANRARTGDFARTVSFADVLPEGLDWALPVYAGNVPPVQRATCAPEIGPAQSPRAGTAPEGRAQALPGVQGGWLPGAAFPHPTWAAETPPA